MCSVLCEDVNNQCSLHPMGHKEGRFCSQGSYQNSKCRPDWRTSWIRKLKERKPIFILACKCFIPEERRVYCNQVRLETHYFYAKEVRHIITDLSWSNIYIVRHCTEKKLIRKVSHETVFFQKCQIFVGRLAYSPTIEFNMHSIIFLDFNYVRSRIQSY